MRTTANTRCGNLNQKQRLQQLFFPEGVAFDGSQFNRTAAHRTVLQELTPSESAEEGLVTRIVASWNQIGSWLRLVHQFRAVGMIR
jgi:hypothetical protein